MPSAPATPTGAHSLPDRPHLRSLSVLLNWPMGFFSPQKGMFLPGPKERQASSAPSNATPAVVPFPLPNYCLPFTLLQAGLQREGGARRSAQGASGMAGNANEESPFFISRTLICGEQPHPHRPCKSKE